MIGKKREYLWMTSHGLVIRRIFYFSRGFFKALYDSLSVKTLLRSKTPHKILVKASTKMNLISSFSDNVHENIQAPTYLPSNNVHERVKHPTTYRPRILAREDLV
jgi:hypothetical protein